MDYKINLRCTMKSICNSKLLRFVMVSTLFFSLPSVLVAGDRAYIFFKGGLNQPLVEIRAPSMYGIIETESAIGFYLGTGLGYKILQNMRLEAEAGYRTNSIDDVKIVMPELIVGTEITGAEGNFSSWCFLVNVWYDFPIGKQWLMHLGGGIGAVQSNLENFSLIISPVVPNPPSWKQLLANDKSWEFAYQARIGIAYLLSKRFIIDLDYSYFTTNLNFVDVEGNKFGSEHRSGTYQLSARYLF